MLIFRGCGGFAGSGVGGAAQVGAGLKTELSILVRLVAIAEEKLLVGTGPPGCGCAPRTVLRPRKNRGPK
ncbi:hypothetical protein GCM10028800_01510 [Nesterenkonia populi]